MRLALDRQALRRLAGLLAAAGLGMAGWLAYEGEGEGLPIARVSAASAPTHGPGSAAVRPEPERKPLRLDLAKLERPKTREVSAELFGPAYVPAPPPPPPLAVKPPPPPPEPPRLPFKFLGRMTDKGEPRVFLGLGEATHTVRAGDTVGAHYRVESIADNAVVFTFLPMNAQQTLSIAPAK